MKNKVEKNIKLRKINEFIIWKIMEKSFCQTLNYCILCFDFEGVGSRGKTFGVLTSRWALKACFEKFFGSRNLKIDTEGKSFVNSQETSSPHSITHIKSNLKIRKFSFNSFFNIFFYKSSFPEKTIPKAKLSSIQGTTKNNNSNSFKFQLQYWNNFFWY